jgi:hypothetical protein
LAQARAGDRVLVFGSFHPVAAAWGVLQEPPENYLSSRA